MIYPTGYPGAARPEAVGPGAVGFGPMLADELRQGMADRPRTLPPGLAFDAVGHALFARVTALPGYAAARAETESLRTNRDAILERADRPTEIVDLGAGTATAARPLLDRAERYVAIDPCRPVLEDAVAGLRAAFPRLNARGVVGEGPSNLGTLERSGRPRLVLCLGGALGRLDPSAARLELWRVRRGMGPDDRLLVGFDLDKEPWRLQVAYDDPSGVYEAFAKNALRRANREFGTDFALADWRMAVEVQPERGRVEVRFETGRAVRVRGGQIGEGWNFAEGEPLIAEHAYKPSEGQVAAMALGAGFRTCGVWTAPAKDFGLFLLAPKKE